MQHLHFGSLREQLARQVVRPAGAGGRERQSAGLRARERHDFGDARFLVLLGGGDPRVAVRLGGGHALLPLLFGGGDLFSQNGLGISLAIRPPGLRR